MLTEITAQRSTRELKNSTRRPETAEVALLLFRRLIDNCLHEAKKTSAGLPTSTAVLERAWFEHHAPEGSEAYLTSFGNCCRMLGLDEREERARILAEIDRHWRKSLLDWGRKQWQQRLEAVERMKAEENPAWARGRAVQDELPLNDEETACDRRK